ncbi:hypothetical protein AVEN_123480-1 [Araneus ventricosus]|uniref:Uncharacterized protein n=1 Tax=Araneus ventricosus TaxID=182803 RepID=A0A4Y2RL80_ARAVE|nr:hypothetical protein AVEN_123480-1 [Araneus ventricosus]
MSQIQWSSDGSVKEDTGYPKNQFGEQHRVDFGMKRQNSLDVSNPAGSRRIDGNPAGYDRIEIGAGLQFLATRNQHPAVPKHPGFYVEC